MDLNKTTTTVLILTNVQQVYALQRAPALIPKGATLVNVKTDMKVASVWIKTSASQTIQSVRSILTARIQLVHINAAVNRASTGMD